MFQYKAISRKEYEKEYEKLCDTNDFYNMLAFEMEDDIKVREEAITWVLSGTRWLSNDCISRFVSRYEINYCRVIQRELILVLLCCDKIDKKNLSQQIIRKFKQKLETKNKLDDWLKIIQMTSAFVEFETILPFWESDRNEIINYLLQYNFPLKLFGKYEKDFIDRHFDKLNYIKLILFNFPLDVLNIVESFLPVEKFETKCCIQ